jgi:thiol-disulfide isomerase/thioredoxin
MLRDTIVDKPARATKLEVISAKAPVLDLAALKGEVVVVEFFATWCGPCRSSMPTLSRWQTTYGKQGLKVIGISAEEAGVLHGFVDKAKLPYTIVRDADGMSTGGWGVPAIPTIVVIDRQGVVRYAAVGAGELLDAAEATFKPLLGAKAAGQK